MEIKGVIFIIRNYLKIGDREISRKFIFWCKHYSGGKHIFTITFLKILSKIMYYFFFKKNLYKKVILEFIHCELNLNRTRCYNSDVKIINFEDFIYKPSGV